MRRYGDAFIVNAIVSTIAFPFWAYLMGAVAFANYQDGNLAAILVLTFTAVSGVVSPPARRLRLREELGAVDEEGPRLVGALAGCRFIAPSSTGHAVDLLWPHSSCMCVAHGGVSDHCGF